MGDDPLFGSADEALRFAYHYSSEQYDPPAMNKAAWKPTKTGKGLVGLDGAAQAGFVLAEVRELGRYHAGIICARYAVRQTPCNCKSSCCSGMRANPEWGDAIGTIANTMAGSTMAGCSQEPMLWRAIVSKFFGSPWKFREMAKILRVSVDLAVDHNSRIVQELRREEPKAKRSIDERLALSGILGEEQREQMVEAIEARKKLERERQKIA